jgi:signal transduction histidine kinase
MSLGTIMGSRALDALEGLTRCSSSGSGFDAVCNLLFDSFEQIIPYDRISVALISENGQDLSLAWLHSRLPAHSLHLGYTVPIASSCSLAELIKGGEDTRILNDLPAYLGEHPKSESTRRAVRDGIRSSFTWLLRYAGRPIGFLFFSSAAAGTYNERHRQIFALIASTVSSAIAQEIAGGRPPERAERDRFYSQVVHDLKNPVGVIKGWTEIILDGGSSPPQADLRLALTSIHHQTELLERLIDDIQNAQEARLPELSVRKQQVKLRSFLEMTKQAASALARQKQIEFRLEFSDEIPEVIEMDPQRFSQALGNLISNAIKYSLPRTLIRLRVTVTPSELIFSVQDEGTGIAAQDLPKVFGSDWPRNVPTRLERSSGLGLFIVKRIIDAHGGRAWVESKFGIGSEFHLALPRSAEIRDS